MWENGKEIDLDYVEGIMDDEFFNLFTCLICDDMSYFYDFYHHCYQKTNKNESTLEEVVEAYLKREKNRLVIGIELHNSDHKIFFSSMFNLDKVKKITDELGMMLLFTLNLNADEILNINFRLKNKIIKSESSLEYLGEIEGLDLKSLELQLMFGHKVDLLKPEIHFKEKFIEWIRKYIEIDFEKFEDEFNKAKKSILKRLKEREAGVYFK